MSIVYLLSGSNLGNRWENLCNAVAAIKQLTGEITHLSPVYESPAWGFDHPKAFLNQAIQLTTKLSPNAILQSILDIETRLGRKRNNAGYEARIIDIDILFYDNLIIDTKDLIIPHPRLHERRFALLPLLAIDAGFVHPVMNKNINEMLEACHDQSPVYEYKEQETCSEKGGNANAI